MSIHCVGYYNISELLVKSRSDINAISYKAYTPLGIAAEKGKSDKMHANTHKIYLLNQVQ